MAPYSVRIKLRSSEVDIRRRLRLSSFFTMTQEAAIAHTTELGMGREKTLDKGLLWIITQEEAHFARLPLYDETVTLTSWPGKTMHLYFPRYVRLTDEDGAVLAEVSTLWALMDRESRHIVFPEEYGIRIEEDSSLPPLSLPRTPRLPELKEAPSFTVPYSYLDLNGHMNNTRCLDLAQDRMPPALREREIESVLRDFGGEAAPGETLRLFEAAEERSYSLSGFGEKRLFRLQMTYR